MIVIPAIDIRGGKVVRLTHGDPAAMTVYGDDPIAVAKQFAEAGAALVHVVDLDAALDSGDNRKVIRRICSEAGVPIQTGGGLRSVEGIKAALDAGAARAVAGTAAALEPEFLIAAVQSFGEQLVVALDVKGERVMTKGWKEDTGAFDDLAPRLAEQGAPRFLITQINVDGTMEGPDIGLYRHAVDLTGRPVIASGGVHTMNDIHALGGTGVEAVIVGKAIYEGTISLSEAVQA